MHPFFNSFDESVDFGFLALRFDQDASIVEVLNEARHLKFFGDLNGRVAEADALHMPGKPDKLMMDIAHGHRGCSPEKDFQARREPN